MANNNELLANMGNFVNRIMKFINSKYDSTVPSPSPKNEIDNLMINDVNKLLSEYVKALEDVKIRQALKTVMEITARGNVYLQENKLDNALFSSDRGRCDTVIYHAVNLVYLVSAIVYPFMPTTSACILRQLRAPQRRLEKWGGNVSWKGEDLEGGHGVGKAEYLFKVIDEAVGERLKEKYGGQGYVKEEKEDKKKKRGKASTKVSLLSQVPDGVEKTKEMKMVEEGIKVQSEVVKKIKGDKNADAEVVKKEVKKLLELKEKLTGLCGI